MSPGYKLDVAGGAVRIRRTLFAGGPILDDDADIGGGPGLYFHAFRYPHDRTVLVPMNGIFRVTNKPNRLTNLELNNWGDLTIRGVYWPSCDSRMKADQEPLDYGLAEVLELQPKRFVRAEWTRNQETGEIEAEEGTGETDFGLIAQDVDEIMPEAVRKPEDESTGFWALAYDKLVAVLAKAIQELHQIMLEQQEEIESLKQHDQKQQQEIETLQQLFASLQKRIQELEAREGGVE